MKSPLQEMVEKRKAIRELAIEWRRDVISQQTIWSFETVKHLAFVNGAGLAGAATLYASSSEIKLGPAPAIAFASGLLLAVLDMHINALTHQTRSRAIGERISQFDQSEITGEQLFADLPVGETGFKVAAGIGMLSAVCFVIGVIPFVALAIAR
jgi:hypothetical protein